MKKQNSTGRQVRPTQAPLDRLKSAAEELLRTRGGSETAGRTLSDILQEVQVLQIELELQNDELRLANEDLEWQRRRLTGIYDLAPVGYFILGNAGLVTEVNATGIELLHSTRNRIIGKPLVGFVAAESLEEFHIFYRGMVKTGQKSRCRVKLKSGDGEQFHAQLEGLPVGRPSEFYIAVVDISETVNVRQQLATSNERLQLAMDAALAGTWELDPETMVLKIDQFSNRFNKIAEDRFTGTYASFLGLIHPDERAEVDQSFRTAVNQHKEIDLSCRFMDPEGDIWYADVRGRLLQRAGDKPCIIGIMMDTTEKKMLEAEGERLRKNRKNEIRGAILKAEENQRQRISEVLHDGVAQLMYGIKHRTN
jgi:PAS domain S-box-containing protein